MEKTIGLTYIRDHAYRVRVVLPETIIGFIICVYPRRMILTVVELKYVTSLQEIGKKGIIIH